MSTASTETKPEILSKNLSFRPAFDSDLSDETRPLVIIYSWLLAKAKHMHKYGDFYLGKGFDVLHVKVDPAQLLWPPVAQGVVQQLIDFADDTMRKMQPVLIHGFSVGGYLYGETLVKMINTEKYAGLTDRVKAQIFDSPVDIRGIPKGVSQASTSNPAARKIIKSSITTYLALTKSTVGKHYTMSSDTFTGNPLKTPSLFIYSNADPIGEAARIEEVADSWVQKDIYTEMKCFEDSAHVSHYQMYPVEYTAALNGFLKNMGLIQQLPEVDVERPPMEKFTQSIRN